MPQQLYTIVQHSGFCYGKNEIFKQGLEQKAISNPQQIKKVLSIGGRIFDNYKDANSYEENESYPGNYGGMAPIAPGTFSDFKIDGMPVYIPSTKGD